MSKAHYAPRDDRHDGTPPLVSGEISARRGEIVAPERTVAGPSHVASIAHSWAGGMRPPGLRERSVQHAIIVCENQPVARAVSHETTKTRFRSLDSECHAESPAAPARAELSRADGSLARHPPANTEPNEFAVKQEYPRAARDTDRATVAPSAPGRWTPPLACAHCDDGLHWTSRYGGNGLDTWSNGPCWACEGRQTTLCDECGDDAVTVYTDPKTGIAYPLCDVHAAEWREADAA